MRTALLILLFVHGVLHLPAFFRAYTYSGVINFKEYFSKPIGLLWLITGILFLIVLILYSFDQPGWPFIGIAAVLLSQTLIILAWENGKAGTLVNMIILAASVVALGKYHFQSMVQQEAVELLEQRQNQPPLVAGKTEIKQLPEIVQKWLRNSGAMKIPEVTTVTLSQTGYLRTSPQGQQMSFTAQQYFDIANPAFLWVAEVRMFPGVFLTGRDKFTGGTGEMKIKMLSLVNVVNEKNNEQVNSGSMLRYLGEICWFPGAALHPYITWEEIDASSALARFKYNNDEVEGVFTFTAQGEIKTFEANRYYGSGKDASVQPWLIEAVSYKKFEGVTVPAVCKVTWKLPEGDFQWLDLEVTALEYNPSAHHPALYL